MRCIPQDTPEEEILQIMLLHLGRARPAASVVLQPDVAAEVLEEADAQEVADHDQEEAAAQQQAQAEAADAAKYLQKRLSAVRAARSSTSSSSGGGSSSSSKVPPLAGPSAAVASPAARTAATPATEAAAAAAAAATPARPIYRENLHGAWTKEDVLPFLPDEDSYRAVRDARNGRWYMLHKMLGTSLSRSWTRQRSEARCVQVILQWCWTTEFRLTGAHCPHAWIFDENAALD